MANEDRLTPAQRRFVELDRRRAEVKKFFDEYREATEAVVAEGGVGASFQDEEGVVYKATVPDGTFVKYEKFKIVRTRREGEAKGDLSMDAARALGYTVEGKRQAGGRAHPKGGGDA